MAECRERPPPPFFSSTEGNAMRDAILPDAQRPIFDRLARLTVEVRKLTQDGDGTGSGVVISPSGVIVTAYHVITRSRVVRVRRLHLDAKRWRIWPYGAYKADVIYRDRKADIAVLK